MNETYVLHVTKECNLGCTYCYEQDKTSKYTWDEVKSVLDNIINNRTSNEFHIEFLGGEPMLAFEYIKNTIEYIKRIKELSVNYTITTNGTIINEELVDLLNNNPNLNYAISIDGTKFMNQMRVYKDGSSSYYDVIKNFKTLLLSGVSVSQLPCHLVTTPYNIGYLSIGIMSLYNHGFRSFGIGTIESTMIIGKEYCDRYVHELKKMSDYITENNVIDMHIQELIGMKPREDIRTYVKDETGKVIFETYGRSGDDVTSKDIENYNSIKSGSNLGELITDIREIVYNYHQNKFMEK